MKKNTRNTKGKIISAAWHLFYEQGYDNTTVDDIIFESETSKGSFYHYFNGKDALLSTLSYLFDEKYEELSNSFDEKTDSIEKLIFLNGELFRMIEDTISIELLSRLLSSQLITKSEKHLLDKERTYYKLLRSIVVEGQQKGELVTDKTANDIVKAYAMYERALMYDWCLCNGEYSLREYSASMLPMFLNGYKNRN
ncbi:MAG: TetR/AcrR family transcriptional regulator [Clostridia bacterium]|nr:TetR/AcrR family transcriptional regulator [Clostridia bacterium]